MYAGRVVEREIVFTIFANPRHPYTVGLMESLPGLTSRTRRCSRSPASHPA